MGSVEQEPAVDVIGAGEHPPIESERTFDVPRRWVLPRLETLAAVARVEAVRPFTQTATYMDTLALDLLQGGLALRRQVGGPDAGWHLTRRHDDGVLERSATPLGSSRVRVPEALRAELSEIAAPRALVRVATVRTGRSQRRLWDARDTELADLAVDTVEATVHLNGERIHRWREVELALVEGSPSLLDELTRVLVAEGLTVCAGQAALGRALGEALPRVHRKRVVRAGDVVLDYVAAQVGVLQWMETRVREDQPDAVHKARVATRRLRSALRTFRPLLDRSVTDPLRRELRWWTAVLGAPRDAEVLLTRLRRMADDLEPELVVESSMHRLQAHLLAEHDRAHTNLRAALDGSRYERLLTALTELLIDPPWRHAAGEPADQQIPRLVGQTAKAVNRAVGRALQATGPDDRDEAVHEVRKRIKAARYAAEAAADVVPGASRRMQTWTELQDRLGEYEDSVVSREVIAKVGRQARRSHEDTFTFGVLAEREAATARRILAGSDNVLNTARTLANRPVKAT